MNMTKTKKRAAKPTTGFELLDVYKDSLLVSGSIANDGGFAFSDESTVEEVRLELKTALAIMNDNSYDPKATTVGQIRQVVKTLNKMLNKYTNARPNGRKTPKRG
jgi:hypothetical protein